MRCARLLQTPWEGLGNATVSTTRKQGSREKGPRMCVQGGAPGMMASPQNRGQPDTAQQATTKQQISLPRVDFLTEENRRCVPTEVDGLFPPSASHEMGQTSPTGVSPGTNTCLSKCPGWRHTVQTRPQQQRDGHIVHPCLVEKPMGLYLQTQREYLKWTLKFKQK